MKIIHYTHINVKRQSAHRTLTVLHLHKIVLLGDRGTRYMGVNNLPKSSSCIHVSIQLSAAIQINQLIMIMTDYKGLTQQCLHQQSVKCPSDIMPFNNNL